MILRLQWKGVLPMRMAHFGTTQYQFVRWLGRKWWVRPLTMSMSEWMQR